MKKGFENFAHRVGMLSVQRARRQAVDFAMARVAKRYQIIDVAVPTLRLVTNACAVNVMNVGRPLFAALHAFEVVTAKGFQVCATMFGDELGAVTATNGTMKARCARAASRLAANPARKFPLTCRARLRAIVAWFEISAAAIADLVVCFRSRVSKPRPASLTPRLKMVMDRDERSAVDARLNRMGLFHARQNLPIGAL